MADLQTDVRYIKGIGEKKAQALNKLGVFTLYDLISFFPRRYEDRSQYKPIALTQDGESVCISVLIADSPQLSRIRRGLDLVRFRAVDESGEVKSVDEMRREMQMKHYTSQVLEAHSDMWYILLEETGWSQTEAQEKSPEEIYRALTTQRAIETPEGQFFDFTIADLADNDKDFQYRVYKGSQQVRQEMGKDMQAERERLRDHLRGLGIGM